MAKALAVSLLLFATVPAVAQVSELGLTGGVTYYVGDINPYAHWPVNSHLGGGLMYRYNFDEHYAVRVQGLYSRLEAWDRHADDPLQVQRNLGFRTVLLEASALLEVNFFPYRGLDKNSRTWTPFVFAGLGYFHTDPEALLDDTWYHLQPLGTEGQGGNGYALNQMCLPFGAGLKLALTPKLDLQVEWGLRRTWTDYIDDVSGVYADNDLLLQEAGPLTALLADPGPLRTTGYNTGRARGDANTTDWYAYSGVTLSLLLTRFTECDAMWSKHRR